MQTVYGIDIDDFELNPDEVPGLLGRRVPSKRKVARMVKKAQNVIEQQKRFAAYQTAKNTVVQGRKVFKRAPIVPTADIENDAEYEDLPQLPQEPLPEEMPDDIEDQEEMTGEEAATVIKAVKAIKAKTENPVSTIPAIATKSKMTLVLGSLVAAGVLIWYMKKKKVF